MIISNFPQKAGGVESFNGRTGAVTPQSGDYTAAMVGAEASTNKVTSLSSSSTDTQYPSAKCVYDIIGDVEAVLTALLEGGS